MKHMSTNYEMPRYIIFSNNFTPFLVPNTLLRSLFSNTPQLHSYCEHGQQYNILTKFRMRRLFAKRYLSLSLTLSSSSFSPTLPYCSRTVLTFPFLAISCKPSFPSPLRTFQTGVRMMWELRETDVNIISTCSSQLLSKWILTKQQSCNIFTKCSGAMCKYGTRQRSVKQ